MYFTGMTNNANLWIISNFCTDVIPRYKKTPYSTGIGIYFNNGVKNTVAPNNIETKRAVSLCSLNPTNLTLAPGASGGVSNLRACKCPILNKTATLNHGNPNKELNIVMILIKNKSR